MSLSPRELLVGSVVSYQGKPCIVKGLSQYIMLKGYKEWIGGSQMEGELISPAWMEQLGFEKHSNSNEFWNHWVLPNGWHISEWLQDNKVAGFEEKGVCYWGECFVPVKYIHQLQILYFSVAAQHLKVPKLK